jgi:hypothetical protein
MRGIYSPSDVKSVRNGRVKLGRLVEPVNLTSLTPIDHEMSHKVFKKPILSINPGISGSSDNEVEISLKHVEVARKHLQQEK